MHNLIFEWDQDKDISNQGKHGVSFGEAKTVFTDQYARMIADPGFTRTSAMRKHYDFSNSKPNPYALSNVNYFVRLASIMMAAFSVSLFHCSVASVDNYLLPV